MTDDLSRIFDDANPQCPRCLVLLKVDQEGEVLYLSCPSCGDVFLS